MSGFVALFHPDGRPAERSRVAPLVGAIAHRGPDGVAFWEDGSVALGHALLAVSPNGAHLQLVVRDGFAIVFAGRLDNGDEIETALGPRASDDAGDAALVLTAYRRWGEDSAARLLGDFSFAIWDGARRTLVCARDSMGQQPLFYHASDRIVLVASEPCAILADPDVPHGINEQVAAEYLTGLHRTRDATLNAAVRRILPAHLLIASAAGCRTRRYWDFDRGHEIRYARDAEYAEQFLELFSRAIACRLEGTSKASIFLSGGLDSSAIAGVATPLSTARNVALRALALRFPGRACDEGRHISAVARHTGMPLETLDMVPATAEAYRIEAASALDMPQYPNGIMLDPLRAASRRAGARVVLTGYGGDDWLTGSPAHTTDLLRRGRLIAAWRQLRADARLPGRGYSVLGLASGAVAPLLPDSVRATIRRLRRRPPRFAWLRPEFRRRTGVDDRIGPERAEGFRSAEQAEMHAVATHVATMIGDELDERAAAAAGIEQRHPFNDRRVAQFALALPPCQRWAGGETKVVLRRAMRLGRFVPESVLARDDKAEFSSSVVDAVDALGGTRAFARLRTADAGWVDAEKTRALYDLMLRLYKANDEAYIPVSNSLWSILSLELWLEALETHGANQRSGAA
jgi:asparagine synthase (glutamine-hydrolysing)